MSLRLNLAGFAGCKVPLSAASAIAPSSTEGVLGATWQHAYCCRRADACMALAQVVNGKRRVFDGVLPDKSPLHAVSVKCPLNLSKLPSR